MIWAYWISPFAWSLRAYVINEMTAPDWQSLPFPGRPGVTLGNGALESFAFFTGTTVVLRHSPCRTYFLLRAGPNTHCSILGTSGVAVCMIFIPLADRAWIWYAVAYHMGLYMFLTLVSIIFLWWQQPPVPRATVIAAVQHVVTLYD
jgi:hypothetical protein